MASALLNEGFDIAYAYKPLHHSLGHAFLNSLLFLDWDRQGFHHPIVPFTANAYGRHLTGSQRAADTDSGTPTQDGSDDPPGPQPWRCFQIGAATARAFAASPMASRSDRLIELVASLLTAKKRAHVSRCGVRQALLRSALLRAIGRPGAKTTLEQAEDRGHHELLNWFCLAGAMSELNRKPDEAVFLESWITNSDKVFAVFRPMP